jgi:hypothetical protein
VTFNKSNSKTARPTHKRIAELTSRVGLLCWLTAAPEDFSLVQSNGMHCNRLINGNENANHQLRSFSRNTPSKQLIFFTSVLLFDLDHIQKHGFKDIWGGVNDMIINGSASAILFHRSIESMT